MTRTVESNARLLQAIAGYDGIDDRAGPGCPSPGTLSSYVDAAISGSVAGTRIGILQEAFMINLLDKAIVVKVQEAAQKCTTGWRIRLGTLSGGIWEGDESCEAVERSI